MNLTKLSLKRPVSVVIVVLALVVFGISAIFSSPLELMPEMEMPMLIVGTTYPGAGPEEVEDLVTSKVESAVADLNGVKNITSQSSENLSMVMLELEYGTNMDVAHMDLQEKINMYVNSLPDDASKPIIIEISMDMLDTITLSAEGRGDVKLLNVLDDEIVPEFEKIAGVASVDISGGREDYIRVELKEEQLKQFGLDLSSVSSAIASANFSIPAGNVGRGDVDLTVRGEVDYNTAASLRNIPITTRSGAIIRLSDVADVYETQENLNSISRYNGSESVSLGIKKRQSADTLSVTRAVNKEVERINASRTDIQLSVVNDTSTMIVNSTQSVATTLVLGVIISMAVLFLFFGDLKASLIVGSSMPISLLLTLIIMNLLGISLNVVSLGGLVIGVGMMVDNSIVVVESCFRVKDRVPSFRESALEGAKVVTSSIIASTITTIVVFLPISLMQGMSGQMFKQLGFTIIFSLTASLISALTLVPLLFCRLRPMEKKNTPISRGLARVEKGYGNFLRKTFRFKWLVVLVAVLLLIASLFLFGTLPKELMPQIDQGQVSIEVNTKPGLKLLEMEPTLDRLEQMVAEHPDVERYLVTTGGGLFGSGSGATVSAYLKGDREMTTREVVAQWQEATRDITNCEVKVSSASNFSSITGDGSVQINLQGTDLDTLKEGAAQVEETMRHNSAIVNVSSSLTKGNPQAEVVVDPLKASAYGLTPVQVMGMVRTNLVGAEATTIRQDGVEYSVQVEYPEGRFENVNDLASMLLPTTTGGQVQLTEVAEIRYSDAPQSIMRKNNRYIVTVTGQPAESAKNRGKNEITVSDEINAEVAKLALPEGVSLEQSDMQEQMQEEFSALFGAIATAVLLVFMVMAMQFESARFSGLVMLCIPFCLIGSFGLMWLTGTTVSMVSLMGLLMLVGTVVNNGILFIDTANQLRASMDAETALVYAGRTRLRPILMTTLTTILSMVPMAIGIGESAELMRGMAVVIIGGLVASTLLTLLLIPSFYLLFDGKKKKKKPSGDEPEEQPQQSLEEMREIDYLMDSES